MRATRVTITLRERDAESDEDPLAFISEWGHEIDVEEDPVGITLRWDGSSQVFFPWAAVLRVDRETCFCGVCDKRVAE